MANHEYIDYAKLLTVLKRYDIREKFKYAEKYSQKLMAPGIHGDPIKLRELLLPWELECFVMLSVKAEEWKYDTLDEDRFVQIVNSIRNTNHPSLDSGEGAEHVFRWILPVYSATQFDYMENYWHKLYRHLFYFSYRSDKIDMVQEFENKFGIEYSRVMVFALSLWMIYLSNVENKHECIRELCHTHPKEVELLTIDRAGFIQELDDASTGVIDYLHCLRPSYTYPIVQCNNDFYIPLPHLILRAATNSLMFRLTLDNDALRETIGLEVFEAYLLKIVKDSQEFDQVVGEQSYVQDNIDNQRTPDVMTNIGDQIICFDSKSFTPKIALRVFSEKAYKEEVKRLGKMVAQMYEHIHEKYGVEYDYLGVTVEKDRSNIWGIVVVAEYPYINLIDIYTDAAKRHSKRLSSEEFEWMQGHIGIVPMTALEKQLFSSSDILSVVRQNHENKSYGDHWFVNVQAKKECHNIEMFMKAHSAVAAMKLLHMKKPLSDATNKE